MDHLRQKAIEQHKKNVDWVNEQIRICLMARRLLKNDKQSSYSHTIYNATEHNRPELLPLKEATNTESWRLRFQNYGLALLSNIFDVRHFIYEARFLKWKQDEHPWLTGTPT